MKRLLVLLAVLLTVPLLWISTAAAQDTYLIRPGDVLKIEVLEDPSLNRSTLVLPDGRVSLPLAGVVQAGGRTIEQVQAALSNALAANFAVTPSVFVSIDRLVERAAPTGPGAARTIDVYLMGEVARPGKISVEPGTTVLRLFAEMGGFSNFAATKRIQLRRTDPRSGEETIFTLNYRDIERGLSRAGGTTVADGDVILVPQRRLFE